MSRIRPAAWLTAAIVLFLVAVAGYALLVHGSLQYYWAQIDAAVYRDGGIAARNQPAALYARGFGPAKLPFIYAPFSALLFAAGSGLSFAVWQFGVAVLTIGLLPVVAYLSLGLAGRPAGLARAAAAFAIAAVSLWLEPVAMTLFFGQINLVLLALVVGDLALPDRVKGKGIGIGLAAGIKLTPLIFIPYLLFTRRTKAAAVGALTFAVTVGLGFALLPRASAVFWREQFTQLGSKHYHLDNQSLNGVMLRLTHSGPTRTRTGWSRRSSSASPGSPPRYWRAGAATSYSDWSRAPRPDCWCPRSAGRTTTFTWCRPLSSPRTGHGASATGSSAPRWWWACLAGGPCLSATRAATTLRPRCCRAGFCFLRRTGATTGHSSTPGVGWN